MKIRSIVVATLSIIDRPLRNSLSRLLRRGLRCYGASWLALLEGTRNTHQCTAPIQLKGNEAQQRGDPMDPIIFTPRRKLTLVTKAERGSSELEWFHELRSNEEATWWRYDVFFVIPLVHLELRSLSRFSRLTLRSIYGQAKSIEDTEDGHQKLSANQ